MSKVSDIERVLSEKMPYALSFDWDNVGLNVGNGETDVESVMLTVDITSKVIDEAAEKKCKLIVSHHPIIFNPIKSVRVNDYATSKIYRLIENGISALVLHTNLDVVIGGMNEVLCKRCGLEVIKRVAYDGRDELRIACTNKPMEICDFAGIVKKAVKADRVIIHDAKKRVNKIGVLTGSGASELDTAFYEGCDTFLTGELKHSDFVNAEEMGMNIVCAGHYYTERCGLAFVRSIIEDNFPHIKVFDALSTESLYKFI